VCLERLVRKLVEVDESTRSRDEKGLKNEVERHTWIKAAVGRCLVFKDCETLLEAFNYNVVIQGLFADIWQRSESLQDSFSILR
jgi:hypothetical protein